MNTTNRHPKGLYLIFATSTAERFSYYGMRAIFILFLTQALLLDTETAASIYGSYTGLVYLTPLIGGYVADKYWGIRRSVFWGAVLMAVGQFLMFFSASMLDAQELSRGLMYGGLTFLILGNGFFKPTVSSLVGQLYEPGDRRLDSAYTIFYMGVNVGSFLAPLVCGYFGETGNPQDFKWGFLIAAIVTVLTVVLFETQKNRYLIGPDGQQLGIVPDARKETEGTSVKAQTPEELRRKRRNLWICSAMAVVLALFFYGCFGNDWISIGIFTACIVFPASILMDGSLTKIERDRIPGHLHHRLLRHLLLGSLRASRRFAHAVCLGADRPRHLRLGNACFVDSVVQSLLRRHVGRRVGHPLPAVEEIAEDDARSGINSLPLHQFNIHKSHG